VTNISDTIHIGGAGAYISLINPEYAVTTPVILANEANTLFEKFTIDIHVVDKDGTNLSGVTINLYGSDSTDYDTAMWTEDTISTASDGTITEQTITTRKWVGTSATLTNYNVFKMTLEKSGYETLELENITIDAPVDWHLELQDRIKYDLESKRYEAVSDNRIRRVA